MFFLSVSCYSRILYNNFLFHFQYENVLQKDEKGFLGREDKSPCCPPLYLKYAIVLKE